MVATRRTRQQAAAAANSSDGGSRASARHRTATADDRTPRRSARRSRATSTTAAAATASRAASHWRAWSEEELTLLVQVAGEAASEPNATWASMAAAYQRTIEERGLSTRSNKSIVTRLAQLHRESPGTAPIPRRLRERLRERGRETMAARRPVAEPNPHAVAREASDSETDSDTEVVLRSGNRAVDRDARVGGGQHEPRVLDEQVVGEITAAITAAAVAAVFRFSRRPPP